MSIRNIVVSLLVLWVSLGLVQFAIPPSQVYHYLRAVVVAAGIITIVAYSPAAWSAWKHKDGIRPAHLLAFGIMSNWFGLTLRMVRWWAIPETPMIGEAQWLYNTGLWISITAAALLVGALVLSEPRWSLRRIGVHCVAFVILVGILWAISHQIEELTCRVT